MPSSLVVTPVPIVTPSLAPPTLQLVRLVIASLSLKNPSTPSVIFFSSSSVSPVQLSSVLPSRVLHSTKNPGSPPPSAKISSINFPPDKVMTPSHGKSIASPLISDSAASVQAPLTKSKQIIGGAAPFKFNTDNTILKPLGNSSTICNSEQSISKPPGAPLSSSKYSPEKSAVKPATTCSPLTNHSSSANADAALTALTASTAKRVIPRIRMFLIAQCLSALKVSRPFGLLTSRTLVLVRAHTWFDAGPQNSE